MKTVLGVNYMLLAFVGSFPVILHIINTFFYDLGRAVWGAEAH